MGIKLTRDTVVGGCIAAAGDVLCIDERTAEYLIALGKAQEYTEPELSEDGKAAVLENSAALKETAIKSAPEKRKR